MGRYENFAEVLGLLKDGQFVSDKELNDAWVYAQGVVFEAFKLCEGLMAGYKAQQETIKRKDSLLEAKIRQLQEKDRAISALNEKLRREEEQE